MAHMDGHMYMTTLRTLQPGDKEKADAIVAAAKEAMAPYTGLPKGAGRRVPHFSAEHSATAISLYEE
jgi:hypothetical protein